MTNGPVTDPHDPRMRRAITEIERLITSRYPETTFAVTRSVDLPGIRVLATVDVDDIAEVLDRYLHRLAQLQVAEGLPLSVIPVQTPAQLGQLARRAPRIVVAPAPRCGLAVAVSAPCREWPDRRLPRRWGCGRGR